jgi:UDP-glucose 6-dehydrogenase
MANKQENIYECMMVGAGYVGLVSGACLLNWNNVSCMDIDEIESTISSQEIFNIWRGLNALVEKMLDWQTELH